MKTLLAVGILLMSQPLFAITAKQAECITEKALAEGAMPEWVSLKIRSAANRGECILNIYGPLEKYDIELLRNAGFHVADSDPFWYTSVSWGICAKDIEIKKEEIK